jgi:hypothetical protein
VVITGRTGTLDVVVGIVSEFFRSRGRFFFGDMTSIGSSSESGRFVFLGIFVILPPTIFNSSDQVVVPSSRTRTMSASKPSSSLSLSSCDIVSVETSELIGSVGKFVVNVGKCRIVVGISREARIRYTDLSDRRRN